MKRRAKDITRLLHLALQFASQRLVAISILLGGLCWLLEAFMHSHIFYEQHVDFLRSLFFPDMHELWMRLSIFAAFTAFGIYAQHMVRALRRAETRVNQINMELNQIFNTSADGMRVIDKDFNMLRFNSTFLDLAGIGDGELDGRKCYEVFRGAYCHGNQCPMYRVQRGEERIEYDDLKIRCDEERIPCIVTATPFRDNQGNLIGIVEDFKDISDRKMAEEELRRSHEQLRRMTSRLEVAREQERRSIAREIHDQMGQALTGLKMDLHWLTRRLGDPHPGVINKIEEMNQQLDHTMQVVQRVSSELRPCLLDDLGLSAALEWQADKVQERLGIAIDFVSIPEDITPDETLGITVFRIFQEALTNIARHADANQVEVLLIQKEKRLALTVRDNGCGIGAEQLEDSRSYGLIGMRERAALLDGTLTIHSVKNRGTTIQLSIPLEG